MIIRLHPFHSTTRAAGLLLTGLALVACDPTILLGEFDGDDPPQGQGSSGTEGQSSGGETGGGDTSSGSSSGGDTGEDACDAWLQDCPVGQKCAPYWTGGDGPTYDAFHCVPLDPTPQPVGSSCHITGEFHSGEDDCELGAVCFDADAETFEGHCVALCEGSLQAPLCDQGFHCASLNGGVFNICLPDCDPLTQDCADGETCIPLPDDLDTFLCVLDAGGDEGQAFDPCTFANACDPGLFCTTPDAAAECSQSEPGCCIPFCDLSAPNSCPGAGQTCLPWFEQNQAPPGKEDTGVCGLAP